MTRIYAPAQDINDIRDLSRSPLITDAERARIDRQISEGMTPDQASEWLVWLARAMDSRAVEAVG